MALDAVDGSFWLMLFILLGICVPLLLLAILIYCFIATVNQPLAVYEYHERWLDAPSSWSESDDDLNGNDDSGSERR